MSSVFPRSGRLRGMSTWQPRRCRDRPRTIHAAPAAAPRLFEELSLSFAASSAAAFPAAATRSRRGRGPRAPRVTRGPAAASPIAPADDLSLPIRYDVAGLNFLRGAAAVAPSGRPRPRPARGGGAAPGARSLYSRSQRRSCAGDISGFSRTFLPHFSCAALTSAVVRPAAERSTSSRTGSSPEPMVAVWARTVCPRASLCAGDRRRFTPLGFRSREGRSVVSVGDQ